MQAGLIHGASEASFHPSPSEQAVLDWYAYSYTFGAWACMGAALVALAAVVILTRLMRAKPDREALFMPAFIALVTAAGFVFFAGWNWYWLHWSLTMPRAVLNDAKHWNSSDVSWPRKP